jgi:hypothetical protein
MLKMAHATVNHWFLCGKRGSSDERLRVSAVQYKPTDEEKGRNLIPALTIRLSFNPYFVLPPSTPSFSLAAACAAASRAVSTRKGEHET